MPECQDCRFWRGRPEYPNQTIALSGYCRRYAPRVFTETYYEAHTSQTRFPRTERDDWCGEFQPKDRGEPELPPSADHDQ